MKYDDIDETIIKILAIDKWGISVGGKVSSENILSIEDRIKVRFCPDYREFLSRYGLFGGSQEYIAGIWSESPEEESEGALLYHQALFEEENFELGNKTVLDPGGEEYYRIIDHDNGILYNYDRFSKKLEKNNQTIKEYIAGFVYDCYELAQS